MENQSKSIIIIDSGASKSDWRIINERGNIEQVKMIGLNPYFISGNEIKKSIEESIIPLIKSKITSIFFYGSGLESQKKSVELRRILLSIFECDNIHIHGDLLAAARSTCGENNGLACISGTGSGACLFKEGRIEKKILGNGIWLGDEGSAGHIGKSLIISYLEGELPVLIKLKFEKRFIERRNEIIQKVYQEKHPNKYLAGFSKFVYHNKKDPFCFNLVYNSFDLFFKKSIKKIENYKNYPVHFVGSTAYFYSDIIRKVAQDNEIQLGRIIEKPISGLCLFHSKELEMQ